MDTNTRNMAHDFVVGMYSYITRYYNDDLSVTRDQALLSLSNTLESREGRQEFMTCLMSDKSLDKVMGDTYRMNLIGDLQEKLVFINLSFITNF